MANKTSSNADYPYTGVDGTCSPSVNKVSWALSYHRFLTTAEAESRMLNNGPITVAVNAGNSLWYNYTGGIIRKDNRGCGTSLDHAVSAVGLGYETVTTTITVEVPDSEVCVPAKPGDIKKQSCRNATYKTDTQECCVQTTRPDEQTVET